MDILNQIFHSKLLDDEFIYVRIGVKTVRYLKSVEEVSALLDQNSDKDFFLGLCTRNARDAHKASIYRAHAVWSDLDGRSEKNPTAPPKARLGEFLNQFILPPSIVVDSGYGLHAAWYTHPFVDIERLEALNKKISIWVAGDSSAFDATKCIRLPGSVNTKYESTVPVILYENKGGFHRYTIEDIECCLGLEEKIISRIKSGSVQGFKSRSERDWSVVYALVSGGASDETITHIFTHQGIGDKFYETGGERYLEHTIKRVRDKLNVAPGDARSIQEANYGIVEKDDCYWIIHTNGVLKQVSTFVFEPTMLLHGQTASDPDTLIGDITAAGNTWENIGLSRNCFTRADRLIRELPLASWQWLGTDSTVKTLLAYLMDKLREKGLPRRQATTQIGYFQGCWVGTNHTITSQRVLLGTEASIVALPFRGERVDVSYSLASVHRETVLEFFDAVKNLNRPTVIWAILGWAIAAMYKTRLRDDGIKFPALNLFGTRGSGKTTLITELVQKLFGYTESRTFDCTTKRFVMLSLLSSSSGVPVSFSEYRASHNTEGILRYILLAYDTGYDPRGRADQTVIDYPLDAPFTIDGEDAILDPAAMERIIQVNLRPETIDEGSVAYESLDNLKTLDLVGLGTDLIKFTLNNPHRFEDAYKIVKAAFPNKMPDRVRKNLSVIVTGLLCLDDYAVSFDADMQAIDAEFVQKTLYHAKDNVVNALTGRGGLLIDDFIQDVVNEAAMRDMMPNDFVVKYDKEKGIMWIHLTTAQSWWRKNRAAQKLAVLNSAAIKAQMKERLVEENNPVIGQYVVEGKATSYFGKTYWMWGIDIGQARESGLDIPVELANAFKVVSKQEEDVEAIS